MEFIKTLLEHNQLMSLFVVIAFGYWIGSINLRGFSLGVGAVLFEGLAVGARVPVCHNVWHQGNSHGWEFPLLTQDIRGGSDNVPGAGWRLSTA